MPLGELIRFANLSKAYLSYLDSNFKKIEDFINTGVIEASEITEATVGHGVDVDGVAIVDGIVPVAKALSLTSDDYYEEYVGTANHYFLPTLKAGRYFITQETFGNAVGATGGVAEFSLQAVSNCAFYSGAGPYMYNYACGVITGPVNTVMTGLMDVSADGLVSLYSTITAVGLTVTTIRRRIYIQRLKD